MYSYNQFCYCCNNPIIYIDSDGYLGILATIAIMGVIVAAVATGILCGYRWMNDLKKTKKYKKMLGGGQFLNSAIYFILVFLLELFHLQLH